MNSAKREAVMVTAALLWVAVLVWFLRLEAIWWVAKG